MVLKWDCKYRKREGVGNGDAENSAFIYRFVSLPSDLEAYSGYKQAVGKMAEGNFNAFFAYRLDCLFV
jgi:hypothetical protein